MLTTWSETRYPCEARFASDSCVSGAAPGQIIHNIVVLRRVNGQNPVVIVNLLKETVHLGKICIFLISF